MEIGIDMGGTKIAAVGLDDDGMERGRLRRPVPASFEGVVDAVAEMVADCYDGSGGACTRRVVRGGSWASRPHFVRSAYRSWCAPTLRNSYNGFRVARSLAPR